MPTYSFQEKMDERQATEVQGVRTYTRVYQLISDVRVDEATAAAYVRSTGVGLPGMVIGTAHPVDTDAILNDVSCDDDAADGRQWKVTAKWTTITAGGDLSPDPLARPAEYTWSTANQTDEILFDFSATPQRIANSVGMPFDTLPTRDTAYCHVECTRNETTTFFRTTVLPLVGYYGIVVNSGSITIDGVSVPALKARLTVRSAQKITEGATTYYRVVYCLELTNGPAGYDSDGWRTRYLDRGHYCNGTQTESFTDGLHPIRDCDGQVIQEPYPLDGTGRSLTNSTDAPAVLGPFKLYPEVSFTALAFT